MKGIMVQLIEVLVVGVIIVFMGYYVLQKFYIKPLVVYKPYTELTSLAALGCAIDVVSTGNLSISTCQKTYDWGVSNIFVGFFESLTQRAILPGETKKTYDVKCEPKVISNEIAIYECRGRTGVTQKIECKKSEGQSYECYVRGFELIQKFTKPQEDWVSRMFSMFFTPLKIFGKVVESSKIKANPILWLWGVGIGEPKYLIYYQTFPKEAEAGWLATPGQSLLLTFAMGAATNLVFDSFGYAKKVGSFLKSKLKEGTIELVDESAKRMVAKGASEASIEKYSETAAKKATKEAYEAVLTKYSKEIILSRIMYQTLVEGIDGKIGKVMEGFVKTDAIPFAETTEKVLGRRNSKFIIDKTAVRMGKNFLGEEVSEEGLQKTFKEIFDDARYYLPDEEYEGWVKKLAHELEIPDGRPLREIEDDVIERLAREYMEEYEKIGLRGIISGDVDGIASSLSGLGKQIRESTQEYAEKLRYLAMDARNIRNSWMLLRKSRAIPGDIFSEMNEEVIRIADETTESIFKHIGMLKKIENLVEEEGGTLAYKPSEEILTRSDEVVKKLKDCDECMISVWEAMARRLKSFVGLPRDLKSTRGALQTAAIAVAATYALYYHNYKSEKYDSCGANSLCLHTQPFWFLKNNYALKLENKLPVMIRQESDIFLLTALTGLLYGYKNLSLYVASPCKSDLKVYRGKIKCKFIPPNTLAYRVPFICAQELVKLQSGCIPQDITNLSSIDSLCNGGKKIILTPGECDKKYNKKYYNADSEFFWENVSEKGLTYHSTILIPDYERTCKEKYETKDPFECIRRDFNHRLENTDFTQIKLFRFKVDGVEPSQIGESVLKSIFERTPLMQLNVKLNLQTYEPEVLSFCLPRKGWWTANPIIDVWDFSLSPTEVDSVMIEVVRESMRTYDMEKPENQRGFNYCVQNRGKTTTTERLCAWGSFVPWELIPYVGVALDVFVGGMSEVCLALEEIGKMWPHAQYNP